MEFRDYYQILGVSKTADADEIRKAFRRLARKYHPDVSKEPDAASRMSEINEANNVLSDPEKRAAYDALGSGYGSGQDFRPPPEWNSGREYAGSGMSDAEAQGFSDFFASMFGDAARGGGPRGGRSGHAGGAGARQVRGEDHHAKVTISLADAYNGATRSITLRGARLDDSGHVVSDERTLNVNIPKGLKEGQHIRLAGQGSPGFNGGPAGDLFLEIHFAPDARYRIDGRDVIERMPLAPWEAALGATVEMPTPSGAVQVKVPPGSQTGSKLRLRGRGIPGDPPGDLYLEVFVVLPAADTAKAREIYESMARDMSFNPRASATGTEASS
jgi:curved DNA-binding protein